MTVEVDRGHGTELSLSSYTPRSCVTVFELERWMRENLSGFTDTSPDRITISVMTVSTGGPRRRAQREVFILRLLCVGVSLNEVCHI